MKATIALLIGLLWIVPAQAKDLWVVSYLCGSNPVTDNRVVKGVYATTVILTNTARRSINVMLQLSFIFPPAAFTPPNSIFPIPGRVSAPRFVSINPNRAVSLDCEEIMQTDDFTTGPITFPPYVQGSLLIRAPKALDVQVTYSSRNDLGDSAVLNHVPVSPR